MEINKIKRFLKSSFRTKMRSKITQSNDIKIPLKATPLYIWKFKDDSFLIFKMKLNNKKKNILHIIELIIQKLVFVCMHEEIQTWKYQKVHCNKI